jgi:hypothetical protein
VKAISRAFLAFLLICWFPGCAEKDEIVKGTCQGIYEMSHTMHKMEHPDDPVPLDREHPSYDQYERERDEMLGSENENQK